ERLESFPRDAEERALNATQGGVSKESMQWYIGKKAIGRLGCYGCHDIPGFETAKPIGTGLNDWGKKDADRLAFEDAESFVKSHYNIVPSRTTRKEVEARIKALEENEAKSRGSASERRELKRLRAQLEVQDEIADLKREDLEKGLSGAKAARLRELASEALF